VGLVKSLTTFFGVPKGEDNMRVVYDGSLPGLNSSLCCPCFMLPNTNSHLRTVETVNLMSDVDIAEMFLNFFLDWHLIKYAGVDLTSYFDDDLGKGKYIMGEMEPDCRGTQAFPILRGSDYGLAG
jgi:hypothetical protein